MPRFAANLSFMFNEYPFLDRFAAAARCGFKGVEFLFPYDFPADELASALKGAGLEQALFNLPPGDWNAGERGLAAMPGREAEFAQAVEKALLYAEALNCPTIHAMPGLVPAGADLDAMERTYVANLRHAAAEAAKAGRTVVIEPINPRDIPGFYLNTQGHANRVIDAVGAANLKIQMDLYHCQIVEGDLTRRLEGQFARVGHVQIASVPERHEPDEGEVNCPTLFARLDELGYAGWIGLEYRPRGRTEDGLGWAAAYGIKAA